MRRAKLDHHRDDLKDSVESLFCHWQIGDGELYDDVKDSRAVTAVREIPAHESGLLSAGLEHVEVPNLDWAPCAPPFPRL